MSRWVALFSSLLVLACSHPAAPPAAPRDVIEIGDEWILVRGEKVERADVLERAEDSPALDQALARIKPAAGSNARIIIQARPKVGFLVVKRVMRAADQAGFHDVDFAVLK